MRLGKRRFLAALMVLAVVAMTGLAATNANLNSKGYPIVKQPITIKMMGSKTITHGPWEKMLVFQEVEKKTGIHIIWDTPPENIYMERKSIIFAANELPDAFFKGQLTSQELADYGSQGLLIPLNKLIDKYAPNVKKVLRQFPKRQTNNHFFRWEYLLFDGDNGLCGRLDQCSHLD